MAHVESPGPIGALSAAAMPGSAPLTAMSPSTSRVRIPTLPGFVMSLHLTGWPAAWEMARAGSGPGVPGGGAQRLKSTAADAMRYARDVNLTGGDRFRRGSRTFRGVPRRSTLVNTAATHSCQRRQLRSGCLIAADLCPARACATGSGDALTGSRSGVVDRPER